MRPGGQRMKSWEVMSEDKASGGWIEEAAREARRCASGFVFGPEEKETEERELAAIIRKHAPQG